MYKHDVWLAGWLRWSISVLFTYSFRLLDLKKKESRANSLNLEKWKNVGLVVIREDSFFIALYRHRFFLWIGGFLCR